MLLYFAVFFVVAARERRAFWSTMPSKAFMAALIVNPLVGTILTGAGLPGLIPLPWAPDARDSLLCNGRVPGCERRHQGRHDQVGRAHRHRLTDTPISAIPLFSTN
jgi:hypothetical protein